MSNIYSMGTEKWRNWVTFKLQNIEPSQSNSYSKVEIDQMISSLQPKDISVISSFSNLPDATISNGKFYWCSQSEGTKWLPLNIGGTFKNNGLYYSNGTFWEFINVPYQATQQDVDAAIDNSMFVTSVTLNSASKWNSKVDKEVGFSLSKNDYTDIDKLNLTNLVQNSPVFISGTVSIDFGNELDISKITINNGYIKNSLFKSISIINIETQETSIDDFYINGVSFSISNIIDNTSFDIVGTAINDASGLYTIKYIITT